MAYKEKPVVDGHCQLLKILLFLNAHMKEASSLYLWLYCMYIHLKVKLIKCVSCLSKVISYVLICVCSQQSDATF